MRILYDHQIFSMQNYGGVSRYFHELMRHYSARGADFAISSKYSNNLYIKNAPFLRNKTFLPQFDFRGKRRLLNLINKSSSVKKLKTQDFDVFHPTYYDPYFLDYIGGKPFVLTIYDMTHELFPTMFSKRDKTAEWKKLLASNAAKIIAISKNTKQDIMRILGVDDKKIEVIHLGNFLSDAPDAGAPNLTLPEKYLLYVGDRSQYKNFCNFVQAIAPALKNDANLNVVCGGSGKFAREERALFEILKINNQVHHRPIINDQTLIRLYKKAIAFVYPSLYEGFGMPIIEAFSCGCPSVISNTSSFPEIAEDAAEYFDPYNAASIRETVCAVAYNENSRKKLRDKGFEQLKKFSWSKTAEKTKSVYINLSVAK